MNMNVKTGLIEAGSRSATWRAKLLLTLRKRAVDGVPMDLSAFPPPVPGTLDLRHFKDMPLEVRRVRDSDIIGIGDAEIFRCNFSLWCGSWHQVPAGSVPDDDATLARMAGLGRDLRTWMKIKAHALHGFYRFNDGRWYHRVVCEKAVESWNSSTVFVWKRECDRLRKENEDRKASNLPEIAKPPKPGKITLQWPKSSGIPAESTPMPDRQSGGLGAREGKNSGGRSDGNDGGIPTDNAGREGKGEEGKKDIPEDKSSGRPGAGKADHASRLFGPALDWVRSVTKLSDAKARSLIGGWRKDLRDDALLLELIREAQAQEIQEPREWMPKAIERRKADRMPETADEAIAMRDRDPAWAGVVR